MRAVDSILTGLEANAGEFKRLCEAKACSPNLLEDINKALTQGSKLSCDLDTVMTHLLDLKTRLEKSK
jgi:hypothetical protein